MFKETGLSKIDNKHILSNDLRKFYLLYGGMLLFAEGEYGMKILPSEKFLLAEGMVTKYYICNIRKVM